MMKSSMNHIETNDVNDDTEVSRVERSSSRESPGHALPGQGTAHRGPLAPCQRWSVTREREVVLRLLRGESTELLSRELGVPIYRLEQLRGDNQGERSASIRMRMRRGWADGGRA